MERSESTRESLDESKTRAALLTRQIPVKLIAMEWLSKSSLSFDTRAYLLEHFLPVVVLGCDKLLQAAATRNLVDTNRRDANFNPINFLAQHLMRNNPRYNSQNETSPYMRTMREVYSELREQMAAVQGTQLTRLKEDVRKRRYERERAEKMRAVEAARRDTEFERLFKLYYLTGQNGRLELKIVRVSHHVSDHNFC
jgi:hypothetical protein